MATLVIGGTGHVGSFVVRQLAQRGASARVLATDPAKCDLPEGMTAVKGDLLEPATLREALDGVTTMFLLAAVSPSELGQSLTALDLAHEAGVNHVVYFSQIELDWPDCPHAIAKRSAEELIRHHDMSATILRPAYFFQNDFAIKDAVLGGTYPIPIGHVGADMIDVRDIAEIAAIAIVDRRAVGTNPIVELVGPDTITGESAAAIWSTVAGRTVTYGGDAIDRSFEEALSMSGWQAHDLVAMFRGCQHDGMLGKPGAADRLQRMLGRPLRNYRSFTEETYRKWKQE